MAGHCVKAQHNLLSLNIYATFLVFSCSSTEGEFQHDVQFDPTCMIIHTLAGD